MDSGKRDRIAAALCAVDGLDWAVILRDYPADVGEYHKYADAILALDRDAQVPAIADERKRRVAWTKMFVALDGEDWDTASPLRRELLVQVYTGDVDRALAVANAERVTLEEDQHHIDRVNAELRDLKRRSAMDAERITKLRSELADAVYDILTKNAENARLRDTLRKEHDRANAAQQRADDYEAEIHSLNAELRDLKRRSAMDAERITQLREAT